MWLVLTVAALAAPPAWRDAPSDVIAEATLPGVPSTYYTRLSDLRSLAALYPADCTPTWTMAGTTTGPDARAKVSWTLRAWRRTLTARFARMEPDHLVQLDHEGNKGFVTQWVLDPVDEGTHIAMGTYVAAPPWPFKRYYVFQVQPAWTDCQNRVLQALARAP